MNPLKKKICRLCLAVIGETSISRSLLDKNGARILESLTSIKVTQEDSLPTDACLKCWLNLKLAYQIQQKFLEANDGISEMMRVQTCMEDEVGAGVEQNCVNVRTEQTPSDDMDDGDKSPIEDDDMGESEENISDFDKLEEPARENDLQIKEEKFIKIEAADSETETDKIEESSDIEHIKVENLTDNEVMVIYDQNNGNVLVKTEDPHSYVTCRICGQRIADSQYFEHVKEHYQTRIQCDECDTFCENIKSYHKHVQLKHDDIQTFWNCDFCHSTFRYKPLWKVHMEKAHVLSKATSKALEGVYDCSYCRKKIRDEQKFLLHVKTHYKKECPICGIKITPTNFKKHVDSHSSPPVVCHLCGITYKNWTSLRSHIHYTHSTRTYMCKFCKKVYKKSYDLAMHEKKEHTGEKDHICDICGKTFFTFYNLNKHKKMTHMKLRPHQCQYCKKKFSSKHALVTHERQHTNITPYTCEVCGEGFRQNVSLKAHKKSKHNIVQPETCECKVCGKKFGSQFAILSHMRLH